MGTLRIEGEPPRELPREPFDLARRAIVDPRAVCHAPFASLHVGRTLAPCRHSTLDLGDAGRTSLAEGFGSDAAQRMRERFRQYVVRREECARCVRHWEDGAPRESPSQAEYDVALPPVNGVPPRLRALSIDARVELPSVRLDEVQALLPELDRVVVLCSGLEPAGPARRVIDAVDRLRSPPRPGLELLAFDFVPAADELPPSVTSLELRLPLATVRLDAARKRTLADLADELRERGTPLTVRADVGSGNWTELKGWLEDVLACGAVPGVAPVARDDDGSIAALNADVIATLHGVLYRWSVELRIEGDEQRGASSFRDLLGRLRHWQKLAATRAAEGAPFAAPDLHHPLLANEGEARRLLEDFLRVYHHRRVETWLAGLAQHEDFQNGARERLSLRLVALWLGCVFERSDVRPALRAIYENPPTAAARIEADRSLLASTAMAGWHDGWVKSLELEKRPRTSAPFQIPPPRKATSAARAQVTVIVPSYNHERFVGAAVDSVLAQAGPTLRVVVVDDGSTDETMSAARTRADPRVIVRRNPRNLGLGESLYRALRTVRTPYVAVLNSDDLFHPKRIERLVAALKERPQAAVAASLLVPIDAEGRACATGDSSPIFDGKRVHDWLRWFETSCREAPPAGDLVGALLERNFLVTSSNLVARRDFLLRHAALWRDLEFCVDWQLFLVAAASRELRIVPEPLLAYRLHASNTVWFDEEREWRYYVESHRVVARTLELLVRSDRRDGERRFAAQLELVSSHLASSGDVDWAGVYLGLVLERLRIPSRAIKSDQSRRWIQTLDSMRRLRLQMGDMVRLLGDNVAELLRMRGERPFLRAARNQAEAITDELERVRWDLLSALRDRANVEKLWHQAERERDQEVSGKAELYRRVGEIEGGLDAARREAETARKEAELAWGETTSVHREHEQVRKELVQALERIQAEREQLESGLTETIEGVVRERDRLKSDAERERETLTRSIARLQEEIGTLHRTLEQSRIQLAAERAKALADRDAERAEAARLAEAERERLQELLDRKRAAHAEQRAELERDLAQQKALADQRTREREELRRSPEFRAGDLLLNRMKLKSPLRALEKRGHAARLALATARLAAERRGLLGRDGGRPRILATVCWNFPIYSQTFVYQELLQMARRGFELRLSYTRLEPRDHLNQQFAPLWRLKRPMLLDRAIHRRDFQRYRTRFPDRVERITEKLCAASGMARAALLAHDNFLQGFTYARLAEAWGAHYLHSYFFYDRSLMALIASQLLDLPRGVSCYADHLLEDYELKVVPLHLETCDVVVATSERIKRELLSLAPATDPDKILVKPNAIDCTSFPVIPRVEPEPGQPFRIVVTSRLEPKKGLIHLVEAMKLLRDQGVNVEAHLVGDADRGVPASENCKAELSDRITRHDLWGKVHLEGRQPEQGVRRFLSLAHLFVAPFVETESGDKDGIPTALVEAMATGIPSVVTDAGSILEVVDDGVDAQVVPQRDPAALAAAIRELLADPRRRRTMSEKAAQKARERFDVSVCEPRLHERIRALVAARRK